MAENPVAPAEVQWSLEDPAQKRQLDLMIQRWIEDDEKAHRNYWSEWDEVDDRLNGTQVPNGWSTDYSGTLAAINDPTTGLKEAGKIKSYVTINRTRPNHESVLGDFIAVQRKLTITGTTPKGRGRAEVVQKRVSYLERKNMLPITVYFPAMDGAFSHGIHWADVWYDPAADGLKGAVRYQVINCRDVLLDNQATGPFYDNAGRITHRSKMLSSEFMKRFGSLPTVVGHTPPGDTEYDQAYGINKDRKRDSDSVTLYRVHFRVPETRCWALNPQTQEAEPISEAAYQTLAADPKTANLVFEEQRDAYYIALYNKVLGTLDIKANPYSEYTLFPLVNMVSSGRLYPMGDVKVYANLADLLDVLVTVILENAKRMNRPIGAVDEQAWDAFPEQIKAAFEHGGPAPGIQNVWNHQPINQYLMFLVPQVIGWIQDSISRHSASQGELPTKQIAKETVQLLVAKDRQAHGRKDITLAYFLTKIARVTVKMIHLHDTDPDFFQVTDAAPGEPGYIPINQAWTEEEYLSNLAEISGMRVPEPPPLDQMSPQAGIQAATQYQQAKAQFEAAFVQFKQKFESENEVKVDYVPGYALASGQQFTEAEMGEFVNQAKQQGLTEQDLQATYQPQPTMVKMYLVNDMTEDPDLNIEYIIDTDYENDIQFRTNRALLLNQRGAMARIDMLREMRVNDAESLVERADKENQIMGIAKQLAANPEMYQAVMQTLQGMTEQGQAK